MNLNPDRLWASLHAMAAIGATPAGGCDRQALSAADAAARAQLLAWGREIGLTPILDRVGNLGLRRDGTDTSRKPVAIGSHLDTVPTGGRYDGAYGVLAGLEILRALHEAGTRTKAPLLLINWTNEEGARFSPAMGGSETAMGFRDEAVFLATPERAGTIATVAEELARNRLAGDADPAVFRDCAAYFEAHIEQGPILEGRGATIGIVTHALGVAGFQLRVTGRDGHVGAPMAGRADALAAGAEFVLAVEALAHAQQGAGHSTVTRFGVFPDARGNIVSSVRGVVSARHDTQAGLEAMVAALHAEAAAIAARRGVTLTLEQDWGYPHVVFDASLRARLAAAADRHGFARYELPTPIGHDAIHVGRVLPTALLFIPCVGGLSHHPEERITPEWSAAGLRVLADAVLETANA